MDLSKLSPKVVAMFLAYLTNEYDADQAHKIWYEMRVRNASAHDVAV
jgi:hypothetical protein